VLHDLQPSSGLWGPEFLQQYRLGFTQLKPVSGGACEEESALSHRFQIGESLVLFLELLQPLLALASTHLEINLYWLLKRIALRRWRSSSSWSQSLISTAMDTAWGSQRIRLLRPAVRLG
jgi:hypothetical protein